MLTNDLLLEIAKRPVAKSVYNRLPLPVRLPQALERTQTAWTEKPLADRRITLGSVVARAFAGRVRELLTEAGAEVGEEMSAHGLVFDATEARHPEDLGALYQFFHPRLRPLRPCGHIVVIGREPDPESGAAEWATQHALSGFVRTVGKEVGARGATAQLLIVPNGEPKDLAERVAGPLVYFLSPRAAYISGQVVRLSARLSRPSGIHFPEARALNGKVALVTGAAQGIGAAIARTLAREGARVLGVDHPTQAAALDAVMAEVVGRSLTVDLREAPSAEAIARWIRSEGGRVDIVVNNAGITRDKTLAKMEPDAWQAVLDINLEAPLRLTERLSAGESPLLTEGGRLIYLSSVVGIAGNVGQANYTAAKAGLLGLVAREAEQLAARGTTVNAIAPGFIETQMTRRIPFATREVARRLSSLRQGGLPEDVAQCATFLASPGAYAVTGATIRVCGQSLVGA